MLTCSLLQAPTTSEYALESLPKQTGPRIKAINMIKLKIATGS